MSDTEYSKVEVEPENPQRPPKAKRKLSAEHLEKMRAGRKIWLENKKRDKSDSIIAILEGEEEESDPIAPPKEPPKPSQRTAKRKTKKPSVVNNYYYEDEESSGEDEVVNNYYHTGKQRQRGAPKRVPHTVEEPQDNYEPEPEPVFTGYDNIVFR